jgi:ATP-dependent helicase/nuclease subunit A
MESAMPSPSFEQIVGETNPQLTLIRAGAGAGKTTELINRVLSIAVHHHLRHGKFPHLVVTTFTRKATQELKERLQLQSLRLQKEQFSDQKIAQAVQQLSAYVQRQSQLHISTIHGVLSLFLLRYGWKFGLAPQFSIIDGLTETVMIKKSIKAILNEAKEAQALETLLEEKSLTEIIEAVKIYLEERVGHSQAIPFYELQELADLASQKAKIWCEKASDFLQQAASSLGGKNGAEYKQLLEQTIQAGKIESIADFYERRPRITLKAAAEVVDLRDELIEEAKKLAKNIWIYSIEAQKNHQALCQSFQVFAEAVFAHLLEQKISQAQLTMADLESLSLLLLQKHPETGKHFSEEWDYWLIDEYQDTSPRQEELLKLLIRKRNSFFVGDPQQSIYLFRGSRSEVFHDKEEEVKRRGGVIGEKVENFRSRPELLHFFNHLFSHLSPQFRSMKPTAQTEQEGLQDQPVAFYIENENEIDAVVSRCFELLQKQVPAEEICVLSRRNKTLEAIAERAASVGLPVQVHSAGQFSGRREILDALNLLKFLIHPHDNLTLLQLLRSPWFKVSDQKLTEITQKFSDKFWSNAKEKLHDNFAVQMLMKLQGDLPQLGIAQTWIKGLRQCGIFDFCHKLDATGRREANLWKLVSELRGEERRPGFNYLEFIRQLENSLSMDIDSQGDGDAVPVIEPNRVNLMTVHSAKGLQFQQVIMLGLGDKVPSPRSRFFMLDEEEKKFTLSLITESSPRRGFAGNGCGREN